MQAAGRFLQAAPLVCWMICLEACPTIVMKQDGSRGRICDWQRRGECRDDAGFAGNEWRAPMG